MLEEVKVLARSVEDAREEQEIIDVAMQSDLSELRDDFETLHRRVFLLEQRVGNLEP